VLKLPGFARPAIIEVFADALPRTSTRKVKRKEVRVALEALLAARAAEQRARDAEARGAGNVVVLSPVLSAIAQTTGTEAQKLTASTSLPQDLGFDSLMWVELQGQLETATGVTLDPEVLITKETVAEVEAYVAERRGASGRPAPRAQAKAEVPAEAPKALWRRVAPVVVNKPARRALAGAQQGLYDTAFDTRVVGEAFIPQNRSAIVVANHTSHLDVGLVKYALGRWGAGLRPLAAKDYFFEGNPLKVAFFENLTNLVPIDRETGSGLAFEQARAVVAQGHNVLIFPEGTRREDGTLGSFKPLVAKLALATGVDVLPLHLQGCFDAFPRGASVPRFGTSLTARIGPPLPAAELARLTAHLPPVQAARAAALVIRTAVVALSEGRVLQSALAKDLASLDAAAVAVVGATDFEASG
jgi:long-chain acyl-CoA synthetase